MEYRQLEKTDTAIIQSIVREFRSQNIDEAKALSFLNHPSTLVFACVDDDKAVGYCMGYRLPRMDLGSDILQIYHLFVNPSYRNRGIARTLMNRMLDYAKSEKLYYVLLITGTSFTPARKLYESLGGYCHPEFKEVYYWYINGEPHP